MGLLLRSFFGQNDAYRSPEDRVLHAQMSTIVCPLRHIALVLAFRSFAILTSHTLRRWGLRDWSFAWKNGNLLEDSEEILSHCSQLSRNMSSRCVRTVGDRSIQYNFHVYICHKSPTNMAKKKFKMATRSWYISTPTILHMKLATLACRGTQQHLSQHVGHCW